MTLKSTTTKKISRGRKRLMALETRRQKAALLFEKGTSQAEVARKLRVSAQSVSRWHGQWSEGGAVLLQGAERAGRKPKMEESQWAIIAEVLLQGARTHGFPGNLWTLRRVADVIEQVTGIRYHPGHVWKLLGAMGWSLQRPVKRAKERNEQTIREWKARHWPEIKKKPGKKGAGSSSRTKAVSPRSRRCGEPGRLADKRRS